MADVVVDVGTRACLVEVDDAVAAASLASWVRAAGLPAEEVVPAARTVLLDGVDPGRCASCSRAGPRTWRGPGRLLRVAVRYSGPDPARVADHWGCTTEEVSTSTRRWSSRPRSAGSPRLRLPRGAAPRAGRAAPGVAADLRRPGPSGSPTPGAASTRSASPGGVAADRHHRRQAVGRRPRRAGAPGPGDPGAARGGGGRDGSRRRGGRPGTARRSRTGGGAGGPTWASPGRVHWTGALRPWPAASSAGDRTTP